MVTTKALPPGGVGEIKATFKSKGYQGKVKKAVTVETNDPDKSRVKLTLAGKVVADVTVEPRRLSLGTVNRNDPPKPVKLKIKLRDGRGLRIKEVKSDRDSLVLRKEEEDEKGAVYTVSLAEKVPIGRLTGKITIRTNSDKSGKVQVPFYATIQGDVKVSPQLLSFSMVTPGKSVTRELTLTRTGEKRFSVDRIKTSADNLTTRIITDKEGEKIRIEITYDPGDRDRGRIDERLTVFMKDGKGEEEILEVPVYGSIYKKKKPPGK